MEWSTLFSSDQVSSFHCSSAYQTESREHYQSPPVSIRIINFFLLFLDMPEYKKLEDQESDVENANRTTVQNTATVQDAGEGQRQAAGQQAGQMVTVSLFMLLFLGSSYFQVCTSYEISAICAYLIYLYH